MFWMAYVIIITMTNTAVSQDLLEACHQDGCPVCRLEHAADLRYIDRLFYERVNEYELRVHLRASLGFCHNHSRMANEEIHAKALGVAIIYDDLLRVVLEQTGKSRPSLSIDKKCPVCENQSQVTARIFLDLTKHINSEELQAALRSSRGLCFSHLRHALGVMRDSTARNLLLQIQREIITALRAELAEYIRKNDYRFIGEEIGSERDAWIRALKMGGG